MHNQAQKKSLRHIFCIVIGCLIIDICMLGLFHRRLLHVTRASYLLTLISHVPMLALFVAAWCSAIVGMIMHGAIMQEFALSALVGMGGMLLVDRTLALPFARMVLMSFLMGIFMIGAQFLFVPTWDIWTYFQIIANIIIAGMMKYTL